MPKEISKRRRKLATDAVRKVGASPVAVQLDFLKGLMEKKAEANKFVKDPKRYCVSHGVLLDPDVIDIVVSVAAKGKRVPGSVSKAWAKKDVAKLVAMKPGTSVAIFPLVLAGAAVVMAATAVASLVVTCVRYSRIKDLELLRGLGPNGVRMPGGSRIR